MIHWLLILSIQTWFTAGTITTMPAAENHITTNTNESALHYLVREPRVKGSARKGIILLHGVGSNEQDLFSLANHFPEDFYVFSARGPFTLGPARYAWYEVDFSTGKPVINAAQELSSRAVIRKFIAEMKQKYQLDEVYLGGFSQGGIMSFSVGLTSPQDVRGIIAFSGRILEAQYLQPTHDAALQKLNVFLAHGVHDSKLTIQYARQAKALLEKLPVRLSYHEYAMDHQIIEAELKDVNAWLAEIPH